MHDGEVDIDAVLVEALIATQFPGLAHLPVRPIPQAGTVNAIYRLGDDRCVRLPRLRDWSDTGDRELTWLPVLAPQLTLPIPEPLERGEPGCGYPFGLGHLPVARRHALRTGRLRTGRRRRQH